MTYFQHLWFAWKCAGALLIHGLIPCLFKDYASKVLTAHPKVDEEIPSEFETEQ